MVFGPKPRDYTKKVSKSVRRLAFQKALSERIKAGDVLTVDGFSVKEPKTKAFVSLVKGHTDAKKVLLISDSFEETLYRSARNVRPVLLATAADVNTEQLLAFDKSWTDSALAQLAEGRPAHERTLRFIRRAVDRKASLLAKSSTICFRVNPRANKTISSRLSRCSSNNVVT